MTSCYSNQLNSLKSGMSLHKLEDKRMVQNITKLQNTNRNQIISKINNKNNISQISSMLVQNWKIWWNIELKYSKVKYNRKWHHHFSKYTMPSGRWILCRAGNQLKLEQYQLGARNQVKKFHIIHSLTYKE